MTTTHTSSAKRAAMAVAAAASLALALTACSGSGKDGPDPEPSASGPISSLFNDVFASLNNKEAMAAQEKKTEEAVAACMREKGWEYTPRTSSGSMVYNEEDMRGGLSEEEYAKQYGYGIASQPESTTIEPSGPPDPNMAYLETLGEKESEAYNKDLYGDQSQFEDLGEDDEIPEYDPSKAGCYGKASQESGAATDALMKLYQDPQYKDLFTKMETAFTSASTAPAVVEAKSAWASCMAEAGAPKATDPETVQTDLWEKSNTIYEEAGEKGPDPAALEALKQEEITLAVADQKCRASSKYDEAVTKAQHDAEVAFYEANREAVDAFAEAARALMPSAEAK